MNRSKAVKGRAAWRDVPIIIVTSSNDAADLHLAFAAGAIDYITKRLMKWSSWPGCARRSSSSGRRTVAKRGRASAPASISSSRCQTMEHSRAREMLLDLNRHLERRVEEQVDEIRRHARDVDVLNAQLRMLTGRPIRQSSEALLAVINDILAPLPVARAAGTGNGPRSLSLALPPRVSSAAMAKRG